MSEVPQRPIRLECECRVAGQILATRSARPASAIPGGSARYFRLDLEQSVGIGTLQRERSERAAVSNVGEMQGSEPASQKNSESAKQSLSYGRLASLSIDQFMSDC